MSCKYFWRAFMKITKQYLKQIIKEELEAVLDQGELPEKWKEAQIEGGFKEWCDGHSKERPKDEDGVMYPVPENWDEAKWKDCVERRRSAGAEEKE